MPRPGPLREPSCPDENALGAFVQGQASEAERHAIEQHLEDCPDCASVLQVLGEAFVSRAQRIEPGPDSDRAAATLEPRAGQQLGRYRVDHGIGAGGMGLVFAAWDPALERQVALKLLRPELATTHEARERLLREARTVASLKHPNVVPVFDVGEAEGRVFIAMELVDGVTLDRWCALTKPSLERVLDVFRQAGRGLSVAHASGLVHRDFKPQNLLVTTDERVLVTDFGLAFSSQDGAREIAGTPAYMAPEQRRGEASALSDQYGFALCLAEALGASLPAPGAVPELPSRIPDWLRAVLRRALSADPAQRYPSMDPLLADLRGGRGVTASAHVTANALLLGGLTLLHAFWLLVMVWAGVKLWLDPSILDSALEGDAMEETAPAIEGEAQLDEELDEELDEPVEEPLTFTDAAILTYAAYWAVWTALGLLWAPISGLGLSRRKAWARVSTMLYAAFTGLSVLGLPYSGYALYSLSRPDVVGLFADVGAPKSAQEGPVVKGQAHLTINVLAQLGLWLLHLGLFALTLELLRFGSEEGTPETPPIIVVSLVAHGLGIFWAPLNAWGLSKRAAWARWSSMAYGLCTAFTGVGLPYALYAWISLSSASVKARFAETV